MSATPETTEVASRPAPTAHTVRHGRAIALRIWRQTWPLLAAIILALAFWQLVYLSGWRPAYVFPGPATVGQRLLEMLGSAELYQSISTTLQRAALGFTTAVAIGTFIGVAVARSRILRTAVGSLITGLQTMPSIAWFPLAILLFGLTEQAIFFVVVLGAAPSIANGVISGIDDLPPSLLRAARVLGARGPTLYTSIIMPAALPAYMSGLKQGWAFAWRSLMAGEILVIIGRQSSLGADLHFAREFSNAPRLMAVMIVILIIGMVVDTIFNAIANGVRRRRGLGTLRL
jgi:NitT/TauT family transport system permease protein